MEEKIKKINEDIDRQIEELKKGLIEEPTYEDTKNGTWSEKWNKAYKVNSPIKREIDSLELKKIKAYCNNHMYSDVEPYEVVKVVSHQTIEVRPMIAEKDESVKMEYIAGGFAGHCVNNHAQKWFYKSNEEAEVIRLRWSKANNQWQQGKYNRFRMSDNPYKFYDYNF
jgi:hypothetical protein